MEKRSINPKSYSILESREAGLFILLDIEGNIISSNGVDSGRDISADKKINIYNLIPEKERSNFCRVLDNCILSKTTATIDLDFCHRRPGSRRSFGLIPLESRGEVHEVIMKKIETGINESIRSLTIRKKTLNIHDNAIVGMFRARISDGLIIDCNDRAVRLMGYNDKSEVIDKVSTIDHYMSPCERINALNELNQKGEIKSIELDMLTRDGSPRHLRLAVKMYKEEDYIEGFIIDVSDIKKAEEALNESEFRFQTIFEASPLGIAIVAVDSGKIVQSNWRFNELLGYRAEELASVTVADFTHPDDLEKEAEYIESIISGKKQVYSLEKRYIKKDGEVIWASLTATGLRDESGRTTLVLGIVDDISKRKQMERRLKESLREKEILLREIHHRVKNNLQVVSSLIFLQSENIQDENINNTLNESRNRIKSMALIHESLHKSDSFVGINFADYIQNLIRHLFHSYGIRPGEISLVMELEDVYLDPDTAVPCGLMINEIISNSIEHAFPQNIDTGKGKSWNREIRVEMFFEGDNGVVLKMADNGIGLPADFDIDQTETLGLRLVRMMVRQLEGDIEIDTGVGTGFSISFERRMNLETEMGDA
jgi:PAS domain S-box-containing protein